MPTRAHPRPHTRRSRTRLAALTAALAALTVTLAACGSSSGSSAAAPTSHPASAQPSTAPSATVPAVSIPVGKSTHSMSIGGLQRSYRVYRPKDLPASAPLVVVLHGALGSAQQAEDSYGWDQQADTGHFVVAYPDGYHRTWAASTGCCGPAAAQHVDDTAFITAVVHQITASLPIDPDRVYATGISNGGAMDYRLACDTGIFAAIGPDSTNLLGDCPAPDPISVIHIHGLADETFPFNGGKGKRDNGGTGAHPADTSGVPIPQMISSWETLDQCAAAVSHPSGAVTTSIASCPQGRSVELITIAGAGHQWPGHPGPKGPVSSQLDPPFMGLDATQTIWDFFQAHPKAG
jgi:polyhydroxybutyrate depolymerase